MSNDTNTVDQYDLPMQTSVSDTSATEPTTVKSCPATNATCPQICDSNAIKAEDAYVAPAQTQVVLDPNGPATNATCPQICGTNKGNSEDIYVAPNSTNSTMNAGEPATKETCPQVCGTSKAAVQELYVAP